VCIHRPHPHERRWCCESPSLNLASWIVYHALLVFSMQPLPLQKCST
jgi:hypothetical protein